MRAGGVNSGDTPTSRLQILPARAMLTRDKDGGCRVVLCRVPAARVSGGSRDLAKRSQSAQTKPKRPNEAKALKRSQVVRTNPTQKYERYQFQRPMRLPWAILAEHPNWDNRRNFNGPRMASASRGRPSKTNLETRVISVGALQRSFPVNRQLYIGMAGSAAGLTTGHNTRSDFRPFRLLCALFFPLLAIVPAPAAFFSPVQGLAL
jgi:hypothetical protein